MPSFRPSSARSSSSATPRPRRRGTSARALGVLLIAALTSLAGCDPATSVDEARIEVGYADGAMAAVDTGDAGVNWTASDAAAPASDGAPPSAGDAGDPAFEGACPPADCGASPSTVPTCFDGMPAQVLCQRWIDASCRWQLVCGS